MNYHKINHRVAAAENAAVAHLRELQADWRMLGRTAREAMTPGRVVGIGLAAGFALGKAAPIERMGGIGRLLSAGIATLNFAASLQAREAAEEADQAASEAASVTAETGQRLEDERTAPAPRAGADASLAEADTLPSRAAED